MAVALLLLALVASTLAATCDVQPNVDYDEGSGGKEISGLTQQQCCDACSAASDCAVAVYSAWYDDPPHGCWLKTSGKLQPKWKDGVVACWPPGHGPIPPPPPPGPPGPPRPQPPCYTATVTRFENAPVLSYVDGSSQFAQVFNPSWVQPSAGTGYKQGLLVRTQNCTGPGCSVPDGSCCECSGPGPKASVITFAELLNDDNSTSPSFRHVANSSIVFAPHNQTDMFGTEDPRMAFDPATGTYYMFCTCYGQLPGADDNNVELCLATTKNPTSAANWTRHGAVGFGQNSKSAALLIRPTPPHYLYWGAGVISITTSNDLLHWTPGQEFISQTPFGNPHVEAGPPPMPLSTGDFVFFHNSWGQAPGYQPTFVVLNGSDLTHILARGQEPLWSPQTEPWMEGKLPYTCNVANVAFLEAAHPTGNKDEFRVYFGGSDAVVGSAVIQISQTKNPCEQQKRG